MSSILYNIVIAPIELVVEIVFEFLFRMVGNRQTNQGIAIIGVSVIISLLTLPLYRRADAVQQKERDTQKRLSGWVSHIKKNFKGDERFMMLQAYYRENGYSPLQALNGSISLLLEIPFFIAAYHFLSHLNALNGARFLFIQNLGSPDELFKIGSISLNILPILMTTINCISSAIYLKGSPLKDKIQTFAMAFIFLVLLYNSPSGLVVYWTCNNMFSLVKNVFYKLKNPQKIASLLCAVLGTVFVALLFASQKLNSPKKIAAGVLFEMLVFVPFLFLLIKPKSHGETKPSRIIFFESGIFISVLLGLLIPSAVIASSPAEFVDLQHYRNPLLFLIPSTCYAVGFFVLWAAIIRYVLPKSKKYMLDVCIWIFVGVALMNFMCFGKNLGNISAFLVYDASPLPISKKMQVLNLLLAVVLACALFFAFRFKKTAAFTALVLIICSGIVSLTNMFKINHTLSDMQYIKEMKDTKKQKELFTLSKNGKNIIVFMLDRAISGYIPYLFEEKPILKEQFSGFTYYPNTLSHGFFTNFGTPALFGGYEYTPTEMNKRSSESLEAKQNEALKVLPVLFSEHHFDVTVLDPPYAGYKWVPDLSIFNEYPHIKAYITGGGALQNASLKMQVDENALLQNNRTFFCYSLFRTVPQFFATVFYSGGTYFNSKINSFYQNFFNEYSVLTLLPQLTSITDEKKDCYASFANCATHEPCELQLPDYELKSNIDNTGFKTAADGKIAMENKNQIIHYHANMASLLALGKWFDFMRENGVWDNTRIIIVADHGRGLSQFDYMMLKNPKIDVQWCNPLLMVKDFGAADFTTSNEFMTNADVPTLATKGVIEKAINPFTKKPLTNEEKTAHPQMITSSAHWDVVKNHGTTFDTSDGHWFSVHDDIFNEANWTLVE